MIDITPEQKKRVTTLKSTVLQDGLAGLLMLIRAGADEFEVIWPLFWMADEGCNCSCHRG